jgi:DNA-binding transcriptional LysR family regulator
MDSTVEVRQLRAFVALVQQGSVTAAARALGLAQSTISESLSALERAMGTPLFLRRRGSHEVMLTDAGTALLPHARSVLDGIASAHVAVAASTTGARARIAIATNESLSTYVLRPQLEVARRRWPNTTFEVTVMTCAGVRGSIERSEHDLGMILQPLDDESATSAVHQTIISHDVPLVIFAQPAHPLARGESGAPVHRELLGEYPLFISDAAGDFHLLVRRYLQNDGLPGPHIHPTGSVESVKGSVLSDPRAIGLLPAYALADEVREHRVVALRVHPGPPPMRLEALTPAARSQHPAVQQLIDGVTAAYAPAPRGDLSLSPI